MLAMTLRFGLLVFLLAIFLPSPPLLFAQTSSGETSSGETSSGETSSGETSSGETVVYLSGVDDLPLMAGLEEAPDQGVIFDTPDGRIVEAYASGPVDAGRVREFYQTSLPQLGWSQTGPGQYVREGEQLTLEILNSDPTSTAVRFQLKPKP